MFSALILRIQKIKFSFTKTSGIVRIPDTIGRCLFLWVLSIILFKAILSHTHFFFTQHKIGHLFEHLHCASHIRKVPCLSLPTLPSAMSSFQTVRWHWQQDVRLQTWKVRGWCVPQNSCVSPAACAVPWLLSQPITRWGQMSAGCCGDHGFGLKGQQRLQHVPRHTPRRPADGTFPN